jgi:hypothetical protein
VIDVLLGQDDRQQTDLEAIAIEDVGEARRDQRAKADLLQCPGGVLARASGAEILAREEDRSAAY